MKSAIAREIERSLSLSFYRRTVALLTGMVLVGSLWFYLKVADDAAQIRALERQNGELERENFIVRQTEAPVARSPRLLLPSVVYLEVHDAAIRYSGRGRERVFSGTVRNPSCYRLDGVWMNITDFDRDGNEVGGGGIDFGSDMAPGESRSFSLEIPHFPEGVMRPIHSERVIRALGTPQEISRQK